MQPVSKGVSALDLQKIRQQNEDGLQTRATQQLGAELKTGTTGGVSKEEKLTAGQDDQVDLSPKDKSARSATKTTSPDSATTSTPSSSTAPAGDSVEAKTPQPGSETIQRDEAGSGDQGSGGGSQQPGSGKVEYSESQQAFLNRLRELEDQAKTLRDMWRKLYMDYMADQLQAVEDMENFRQTTGLLWTDVTTARWVQGARHSEAIRSIL